MVTDQKGRYVESNVKDEWYGPVKCCLECEGNFMADYGDYSENNIYYCPYCGRELHKVSLLDSGYKF